MRLETIVAAVLVCLCGCHSTQAVQGDGRLVEQQRAVPAFSTVSVADAFDVEVTLAGSGLDLLCDENLVDLVQTDVAGGALAILPPKGLDLEPSSGAIVRVQSPTIDALDTSGASHLRGTTNGANATLSASGDSAITAVTLGAAVLSIGASGSSRVSVSGTGPRVTIVASGASMVDCEVPGEDVDVDASGASAVTVHASTRVRVRASGASTVRVVGSPSVRDAQILDAASVSYED
jgi:hypothetical protein